MFTLDQLCAEMERSGHPLTPRAARDWWTKGLLPRPKRRGLGRGKGTLTFWTSPRILEQARAVDDLLGRHSRAYTAIIGLWLRGFPVDLKLVRRAYVKLIDRHISWVYSSRPHFPEASDFLGNIAKTIAQKTQKLEKSDSAIDEISDLWSAVLNIFYGVDEDYLPDSSLGGLLRTASSQAGQRTLVIDCDPAVLARYLRSRLWGWASLPRQRETVLSATDNELARARRVIHIACGTLKRVLIYQNEREALEETGRVALITFGRPMLLMLVRVLREPLGREIVRFLLQFASLAKREDSKYFLRFAEGPLPLALQGGKG